MSRTHHPRSGTKLDTVLFVRVPKELVAELKKQLAKERRRRPHDHVTMSALMRRVVEQGLCKVTAEER